MLKNVVQKSGVLAVLFIAGFATMPLCSWAQEYSPLTMTLQESPSPGTLLDVDFQDAKHGWIVGAGGTMLHTEDGGTTWKKAPRQTNMLLTAVTFADAKHGWILGQNGTLAPYRQRWCQMGTSGQWDE